MNPKDTKALTELNKAYTALLGVKTETPEDVATLSRLLRDVKDQQMTICRRADEEAKKYRKKES